MAFTKRLLFPGKYRPTTCTHRPWMHFARQYNRPWTKVNFDKGPSSSGGGGSPGFDQIKQFFNKLPTPVRHLIYMNSSVFMLFQIMPNFAFNHFTTKRQDFRSARIYTPVSSTFGHFSFLHFGFNMIMLYFYGPMILSYLSTRQFYQLFLGSGALGSLVSLSMMPDNGATLGASGSIFGIMAFMTMKAPNSSLLLYGVVPMRLWQLMSFVVLIEGWMLSRKIRQQSQYGRAVERPSGIGISHEAHLAGIASGFAFYFAVMNGML